MVKKDWRRGEPIEAELQERLRALVQARGTDGAARVIGAAESSIARAALGLGVRRGTAMLIRIGLKERAA